MVAQSCHASMKVFFDRIKFVTDHDGRKYYEIPFISSQVDEWIGGLFTKIVVSVDSEEEVLQLQKKADEAGIINAVVTDAGLTEFHGIPTITCISIGPDDPEKIDKITGELPLL